LAKSHAELEARIAVLERKIEREKKARVMSEQHLEVHSRALYESNQSLQASLSMAKKKQAELEFLRQTSGDVSSDISLQELITNTVELTGQFFSVECGLFIVSENGQAIESKVDNIWRAPNQWFSDRAFLEQASQFLPIEQQDRLSMWLVSAIDEQSSPALSGFKWIVFVNFELLGNKIAWLAFFSRAEFLDEEALAVLSTAREHLLSGINRRITDVSIRKRTVELQDTVNRLEQAKRQLIQSEKMASLGQLAAGVAHEINNPVGFIRSNLEMLDEYLQDYQKLHEMISEQLKESGQLDVQQYRLLSEKIDLPYIQQDAKDLLESNLEGLDRVKEIVENLKTFSHSGDGKLDKIDLNLCIQSALKIAWNALKYEHIVDNQITDELPKVMGNVGQLQQVFVNLFVNAAYAMSNGGKLTIKSRTTSNALLIDVIDDGCGMDKTTLDKLFTPFFTTKPVGVGTGLGLSVSYAILESHNVQTQVQSILGQGTQFTLSFPLSH
jgi:signal transduction histidine kinase